MQHIGILVISIKSDECETGKNWFQIIVGDESRENFYLCGPSGHVLHERAQISHLSACTGVGQ